MKRSPRFVAMMLSVLSALIAVNLAPVASAQDAPAAAPTVSPLRASVDTFWHYGKIARYDLAATEGKKILETSGSDPVAVLEAFEAVSAERKDSLDQWMLRWQGVEPMKEVATQLIGVMSNGYRTRRADPKFISNNLQMLTSGGRGYAIAIRRLQESGELAVPAMLEILGDQGRKAQHPTVRAALVELGQKALNPLVAATEAKDSDLLIQVVLSLREIGYNVTVPYLSKVAGDEKASAAARSAAASALVNLGAGAAGNLNTADLFYDLGEKFYYGKASISADNRNPKSYIWYYSDNGLMKKDVDPELFGPIMAMRCCEYSLKLGNGKADAQSLWLAANYKRESLLTEGKTDPTRAENQPNADFYGTASGTQYLNAVLVRAEKDKDPAVAIRAIKSIHAIAGQSNLFANNAAQPLIDAMRFPDRAVRYEAAFALAAALPQQNFLGQEQVVPLLCEALSQNGTSNALLLMPSQDQVNAMSEALKGIGYTAVGATGAEAAVAISNTRPGIDVVIVSEETDSNEISKLMGLLVANPRLERSARVILVKSNASDWSAVAARDTMVTVATSREAGALKTTLAEARNRAGALPMDEANATKYALRSAELMGRLAISKGQVLDLSGSESATLSALEDTRPDIAKAAGQVVALLKTRTAQAGLTTKAIDEKTADDLKVSLLKSVAMSVKFNGNQLDADKIEAIQKLVADAKSNDVRGAAAEALGSLNLSTDQAKKQIVSQMKV